jgi:hypothetical protein
LRYFPVIFQFGIIFPHLRARHSNTISKVDDAEAAAAMAHWHGDDGSNFELRIFTHPWGKTPVPANIGHDDQLQLPNQPHLASPQNHMSGNPTNQELTTYRALNSRADRVVV